MPHPTPAARLELDRETLRVACVVDGDLELVEAVIAGAVELANVADELVAFVPPAVNPVVIYREHLAALQAARDAMLEAAGELIVLIVGVQAEEAPADA